MKTKLFFLSPISLLIFCATTFAQNNYYQAADGSFINQTAYNEAKDGQFSKTVKNLEAIGMKVTVNENLKEIRRTADSVLYSFDWKIEANDGKKADSNLTDFDANEYLNKEFPMPISQTIDGKPISINDLKGKPTLINFWFTSCRPCIEEMPVLNNIKDQFGDKVNFIAVTFESKKQVEDFLKKRAVIENRKTATQPDNGTSGVFRFTHLVDAKAFTDSMNMTAFPMNIFLDKNGIVQRIENGIPYIMDENNNLKMGDGNEFAKELEKML